MRARAAAVRTTAASGVKVHPVPPGPAVDYKALVEYVAKSLADKPDEVVVEAIERGGGTIAIKVKLADGDVGQVHRQGRPQHRSGADARPRGVAARPQARLRRPRSRGSDAAPRTGLRHSGGGDSE